MSKKLCSLSFVKLFVKFILKKWYVIKLFNKEKDRER